MDELKDLETILRQERTVTVGHDDEREIPLNFSIKVENSYPDGGVLFTVYFDDEKDNGAKGSQDFVVQKNKVEPVLI